MSFDMFRGLTRTDTNLLIAEGAAIAFLIINFRQDSGTAFLGLAVLQGFLMLAEMVSNGFTVNFSFLKDGLIKSLMYGIVIFASISVVLQQISFQSVLNLQSTRAPILETSKITGNLAQSFLVPLPENLVFFGVGLEFIMSLAVSASNRLGIGLGGAELLSALIMSSAFVVFHITAKISLGVPGIISTFLFGMTMAYASLKLKSTAPGIFAHVLNNSLASSLISL